MRRLLVVLVAAALLAPLFGAHALAQFSGPNEARAPRAAEALALAKAVCAANVWLGLLGGCRVHAYPGSSVPEVRSPYGAFLPVSMLRGSFSRPKAQEVLVQFCAETEGCPGGTVLLRRHGAGWAALGLLPEFNLGYCLTFPARTGTQAAACYALRSGYPGRSLQQALWRSGQVEVKTLATFRSLSGAPEASEQCRNAWQFEPFSWHDLDRDLNGWPDLTLAGSLDQYEKEDESCGYDLRARAVGGSRVDLIFHWDGQRLRPTPQARAFIARYGVQVR